MQLPIEYRRQGISIGDIGIISPTGEFDLHPLYHAINGRNGPNQPLECDTVFRKMQSMDNGPDTHLANSSVRKVSVNQIKQVLFHQMIQFG
jgi:hypothetical protein